MLSAAELYFPVVIQGVPKNVPCVNKNNSGNFYSSRKNRYFLKPEAFTNALNLFRIKQDEFYENRGSAKKESVFQHFHTSFLHSFPISRYFPTLNK